MTTISDDSLHIYSERVKGKVVVITGAANGIGKETALRFAQYGAKVVIGDVDTQGGPATIAEIKKAGGQAAFVKCDVTNWDEQIAMFDLAISSFGAVDIVVANAGITESYNLDIVKFVGGKPVKPSMKTIEVNLIAVLYTTHLSLHYLTLNRKNDDECKALVLIGSMASWKGVLGGSMYAASKHAVLGLMRSQYPHFNFKRMRIACIHPFFADTAIVPTSLKVFMAGIPLTPVSRIAGAIFYAATDPDTETNGSAWLLPDHGPVYRVDREEFKEGVYKMIDARLKTVLAGIRGVRRYINVLQDLNRVIGKPVLVIMLSAVVTKYGWTNREAITNTTIGLLQHVSA